MASQAQAELAVASRFQFDAASHTYRLDGRVIPGVTRVLEDVGIIDYSHIPLATRDMALARGTAVHIACHFDDEVDLAEDSLLFQFDRWEEDLTPYVLAWRQYRRDYDGTMPIGARPIVIEERLYSETLGFAGTIDRYDRDTVVDIKTSDAPWWVRIQLAAYNALLGGARHRRAVELHRDGTYRPHEFGIGSLRADTDTFMAALRIYSEKQMHRRQR